MAGAFSHNATPNVSDSSERATPWSFSAWLRSPLGAVAWSAALLIFGIFIGTRVCKRSQLVHTRNELAAMHSELTNMRQLVALFDAATAIRQRAPARRELERPRSSSRSANPIGAVAHAALRRQRRRPSGRARCAQPPRQSAADSQRYRRHAPGAAIAARAGRARSISSPSGAIPTPPSACAIFSKHQISTPPSASARSGPSANCSSEVVGAQHALPERQGRHVGNQLSKEESCEQHRSIEFSPSTQRRC